MSALERTDRSGAERCAQSRAIWIPIPVGYWDRAEVQELTDTAAAVVLFLWDVMWRGNGTLPDDVDAIDRMLPRGRWRDFRSAWPQVRALFHSDANGRLRHEWVDEQILKADARSKKGRHGAQKRWGSRCPKHHKPMPQASQDDAPGIQEVPIPDAQRDAQASAASNAADQLDARDARSTNSDAPGITNGCSKHPYHMNLKRERPKRPPPLDLRNSHDAAIEAAFKAAYRDAVLRRPGPAALKGMAELAALVDEPSEIAALVAYASRDNSWSKARPPTVKVLLQAWDDYAKHVAGKVQVSLPAEQIDALLAAARGPDRRAAELAKQELRAKGIDAELCGGRA